eukprot:1971965-Amphidinium_carterae.1
MQQCCTCWACIAPRGVCMIWHQATLQPAPDCTAKIPTKSKLRWVCSAMMPVPGEPQVMIAGYQGAGLTGCSEYSNHCTIL